jgi:hypothetical protein
LALQHAIEGAGGVALAIERNRDRCFSCGAERDKITGVKRIKCACGVAATPQENGAKVLLTAALKGDFSGERPVIREAWQDVA